MSKLEPKLKTSFGIKIKRKRQVVNIGQGEFSGSVFNGKKRCKYSNYLLHIFNIIANLKIYF